MHGIWTTTSTNTRSGLTDVPLGHEDCSFIVYWNTRDSELALFRALAALPEEERRPHLYEFLALANRVAMADELPLGDAETLPASLEKAARLASRGLEHLARENGIALPEVVRRVTIERLFRVGHQLERNERQGA